MTAETWTAETWVEELYARVRRQRPGLPSARGVGEATRYVRELLRDEPRWARQLARRFLADGGPERLGSSPLPGTPLAALYAELSALAHAAGGQLQAAPAVPGYRLRPRPQRCGLCEVTVWWGRATSDGTTQAFGAEGEVHPCFQPVADPD